MKAEARRFVLPLLVTTACVLGGNRAGAQYFVPPVPVYRPYVVPAYPILPPPVVYGPRALPPPYYGPYGFRPIYGPPPVVYRPGPYGPYPYRRFW